MILEFRLREHFGRQDFYPENEAARLVVAFKRMTGGDKIKCLKRDELELLKKLGHEIKIVQKLEAV
jgi:hypothetical protein